MATLAFDRSATTGRSPSRKRLSFFRSLVRALAESRMRSAQRELRRHEALLDHDLRLSIGDLPFGSTAR